MSDLREDVHELVLQLQAREAELALIHRIAGIGGVEVDLRDGFRNRRSSEYLMIHGLPSTATNESHDDWVARIHPEDRAQTEKHFHDALRGVATDYSAEYRIVRPRDGQTRWVRVAAQIERDPDGRAKEFAHEARGIHDAEQHASCPEKNSHTTLIAEIASATLTTNSRRTLGPDSAWRASVGVSIIRPSSRLSITSSFSHERVKRRRSLLTPCET